MITLPGQFIVNCPRGPGPGGASPHRCRRRYVRQSRHGFPSFTGARSKTAFSGFLCASLTTGPSHRTGERRRSFPCRRRQRSPMPKAGARGSRSSQRSYNPPRLRRRRGSQREPKRAPVPITGTGARFGQTETVHVRQTSSAFTPLSRMRAITACGAWRLVISVWI